MREEELEKKRKSIREGHLLRLFRRECPLEEDFQNLFPEEPEWKKKLIKDLQSLEKQDCLALIFNQPLEDWRSYVLTPKGEESIRVKDSE